eukprot:4188241-Pyramimonas_sp.AAC.1
MTKLLSTSDQLTILPPPLTRLALAPGNCPFLSRRWLPTPASSAGDSARSPRTSFAGQVSPPSGYYI